jgi:uncharacterized protein (DUF58 family)
MNTIEEIPGFHYQVPWRSHSAHPGRHFSTQSGGDYEFHGHAPLISNPDPRHLDIHASLNDPFGQLIVRTFRQRSTIPVYVIADLSASMSYRGRADKMELLALFTASAAYSAYRSGDPFGFIGCNTAIDEETLLPLRWYKGIAWELLNRLRRLHPTGASAHGLHTAIDHLGRRRALIFLVSDFHFPLPEAASLLDSLSRHDVVPIIVWDRMEYRPLTNWGIIRLQDPETGQDRVLLMRPRLRARFQEAFAERRSALTHLCMQHGREPFFMIDAFDPDALTRYFFHA